MNSMYVAIEMKSSIVNDELVRVPDKLRDCINLVHKVLRDLLSFL